MEVKGWRKRKFIEVPRWVDESSSTIASACTCSLRVELRSQMGMRRQSKAHDADMTPHDQMPLLRLQFERLVDHDYVTKLAGGIG